MKRYWKMGIAGLLVLSMLGASGCGQKEESSEFHPKLDTKESVVLSTAGFFGNFEALDQVTNDFNAYYPNVEFSYEQVGIDTFDSYLDANPNVDVIMTSEDIFEQSGKDLSSQFVDLAEEGISLGDLEEDMLERCYHDGKLLSIPMGQNMYGLVVNVSLLEKEGLSVPKNYDEFLRVLDVLKKKGYTPIQEPESKVYAELTEAMAYDLILSDKTLQKDLAAGKESAAEALEPVLEKLDTLIGQGYIDPSVNETYPDDNYDQAILNFFEGDVPFWVCNTEKVSGMKKRESKSEAFQASPFEYTYIYVPLGENGVYAYREPWFGFSVNKDSANYDYAVEFLRFLATEKEINEIADIKGVPSIAVKKTDAEIYQNVWNPEKMEMDCVNDGTITSAMVKNWYSCVNQYVSGESETAEDALKNFVESCSKTAQ